MSIKNIVFDFDGTCTQIPAIYQGFLDRYFEELNKRVFPPNNYTLEANPLPLITRAEWEAAITFVRNNSPKAGWTFTYTSAAPAAADPYILAHEAAKLVLRNRRKGRAEVELPSELHGIASDANEAPWRPEAKALIETLLSKGINVYFISNSSSAKITKRLLYLLNINSLPVNLKVQSDANKFRICELPLIDKQWALPANTITKFEALPIVHPTITANGRAIFIRRGEYFRAICAVLGNNLEGINETVFCGDIWEMDHAMPYLLGGNIHLITRAAPFNTYQFELDAVNASNGKISDDLNGLLKWL